MNIHNKSNTDTMKEMTRQKDIKAIPQGELDICTYEEYYDVNNITTNAIASPTPPITLDPDNTGYNVESIAQMLTRNAPKIYVANDAPIGGATLFIIVSHGGVEHSTRERPLYPQEVKVYYNVFELRLRSTAQNVPYRVSEYEIIIT